MTPLVLFVVLFLNVIKAAQIPFYDDNNVVDRFIEKIYSIESSTVMDNCRKCKSIGSIIRYLPNYSLNIATKVGIEVCVVFKYEREVCSGASNLFTPWLLQVLKDPMFDPDYACGALNYCEKSAYDFDLRFPARKTGRATQNTARREEKSQSFIHISDYHIDIDYIPFSEASCEDPICCRTSPDASHVIQKPAGIFGEHTCDAPRSLGLAALKKAIKVSKNPKFVLVSGDLPPHNVWSTTKEFVIDSESKVSEDIYKVFGDIPVFMTLGNHESHPSNNFPSVAIKYTNFTWLYESLAKQWSPFLPKSSLETFRKFGYYSARLDKHNLKVISLNTNFGYIMNFWNWLPVKDPNGMMMWLIDELQESEDRNESVYILGHIPPWVDTTKYWGRAIFSIFQRYNDTIKAQFYGHTHLDMFKVQYHSESHEPISVAYICPSITPYDHVNPAVRIFHSNSANVILNHETHVLDLKKSNTFNHTVWVKEYDAKSEYQLLDLSASQWDLLLDRMSNDSSLLKKYNRFKSRMIFDDSDTNNRGINEDLVMEDKFIQTSQVPFDFGRLLEKSIKC